MKNIMKKYSINRFVDCSIVKRTLAVAGMTMGLALQAQADTVSGIKYIDENGVERTSGECTVVTEADSEWEDGWYVVNSIVSVSHTITVSEGVKLILVDGCSLTVNGDENCAAIKVSGDGNSLAIYGQNAGTGKLEATGGDSGAGIGGGWRTAGSNITINGGTVTATGGSGGAGIGGGPDGNGNGSDITINGGTVTATSPSRGGAGIGGGKYNAGSNITINGGTVTATSEQGGAGIGGGDEGAGSNITINGGKVTATALYDGAAAIGSGDNSEDPATNIKVNPLLVLKADGNNPPTTVIPNTGADLANDLKNKRYATVEPPTVEITVKSVENATAYTNTVSEATKLAGEVTYTVLSNEIVTVIYEAKDGYMFPGGYRTLTTNVTASATEMTVTLTAEQQPVDAEANPNCLTFSAAEDFGIKMTKKNSPPTVNLEYSTDQIYWATFNKDDGAAAGADHKLYLCGSGNTAFASGITMCYSFTNTSDSAATAIDCSGNIETLLDYKAVAADEHPEMGNYAFCNLFQGFEALTAAPELPATTLVEYCYQSMFHDCSSLTTAPELPATNLTSACYANMFYNCKSLTEVPELPATNLASQCYYCMFNGCTALTAVPELPATNLADQCFMLMFAKCTSLVVNTNAPGKAWTIPAEAAASAASANKWNTNMFAGTPGDITNTTVTCGVTYYVASALMPVTVELPEVEGATAQLLAFNVNGGWASVATNEVPSNATVRVVWTADEGKALSDEGATGVFMWQTEFGPVVGGEVAPAPTVVEAGESSVTLDIDTRTTKRYFDAADILPVWAAQGAEVKVKKSKLEGEVEELTETLVKNAANTNTVAWTPASVGVYDLSHTGLVAAQIVYTTPVEVTTNDLEVTGTTVEVTADGAAVPEDGIIPSNSVVTVTWTATGSGVYFADGSTTYTQTFEAGKAVNPASENVTKPEVPAEPKLLLGVVAQRFPWDGKIDVQYWAKNTPNEGYEITVTVTLPNGAEASETYDCLNGQNTVAFDARAKFGEVQFTKGVKVKATLIPQVGMRFR